MTLNASAPVEAPLAFKDGGKLRAWNFTIDDGAIVPGNSGSPVTIPGSKEVIGVAIIREGSEKVTVISVDAIRYLKRPDKVPEYLWSNLTNDEGSNHMADIFQKYKTAKKEVLNIYESYKNIAKNNVNLDLLETKISLVKEKKYTLVVAGEVKSGKSTFINALLGEMVLPTGILQNTSSIIEIFSNPKKIVQVEYDDGTYQEVEESSTNITEFLENVAAIQDKYREIPFQRLKKFLMKNNDYPIDNETINDFLEELYENYNDYNLSEEKFQELTKEYLNKYRDLKKIPIEIKLGFPLKKEFEEVRIVDTPGVNAIGGVQDITFDYLNEADAIIFLHSVDGAIESQSFQEFTTKVASTKSNEVMFLVLTKAGNRNSHEVKAKLKDVISRLGKGTLNPERITYFDSLLKIIADHAKEFETFESLMESYEKQTQDFEERLDDDNSNLLNEYLLWDTKLSLLGQLKYRKPKDENGISFRDFILERSNFNVVETKLSQFASKAPFAKLFEIISVIKADYENQKQDYLERIDLLEKSNKPAEQFKREIDELQKKLDDYKSSLENFLTELEIKYDSESASWRLRLKKIGNKYNRKIRHLEGKKEARKLSQDLIDKLNQFAERLVDEMYQELEQKTRETYGIKFKTSKYLVEIPEFRIDSIIKKATKKATKTKKLTKTKNVIDMEEQGWWIFKHEVPIEKEKKYKVKKKYIDKDKFNQQLSKKMQKELENIKEYTIEEIEEMTIQFCKVFQSQLDNFINQKTQFLGSLRQQHRDRLKDEETISKLQVKLEVINLQLSQIYLFLIFGGELSLISH